MGNKVLTVNIRETNEQARRRVYKSKQLDKKIDLIKKALLYRLYSNI